MHQELIPISKDARGRRGRQAHKLLEGTTKATQVHQVLHQDFTSIWVQPMLGLRATLVGPNPIGSVCIVGVQVQVELDFVLLLVVPHPSSS